MPRRVPRTYAITAVTYERRRLFQRTGVAERMIEILLRYRAQQNYLLHSFVVMPDHIHALLTPAESVERSVGRMKGGFSFAIRGEASGAIWQNGYHEHRIRDLGDYQNQHLYIERNPIRRGYADYPYTHTSFAEHLDGTPGHLG